tara:strand:+ start:1453 stop:1638 length:186 start_codon:yes stop_codon:yes gene_type:complete
MTDIWKISEHLEGYLCMLSNGLEEDDWDDPEEIAEREKLILEVEDAISKQQYYEQQEAKNG